MSIWFKTFNPQMLDVWCQNSLVDHLDIRFMEIGEDFLRAQMPVNAQTVQPARRLHGGATAALIETICSVAANMTLNPETHAALGLELHVSHLRGILENKGPVEGICRPVRIGKTVQVWETVCTDPKGNKTAKGQLTLFIQKIGN